MSPSQARIPLWINIFGWVLVPVGLFFTYACYMQPDLLFPGTALDNASATIGFHSAAARALSAVVVLAIALLSKRPQLIALAMAMRLCTEAQDLWIGYANNGEAGSLVAIAVVMVVEVAAISSLRKRFEQS